MPDTPTTTDPNAAASVAAMPSSPGAPPPAPAEPVAAAAPPQVAAAASPVPTTEQPPATTEQVPAVAEPPAAGEAAPAVEGPKPHTDEPSLLETVGKPAVEAAKLGEEPKKPAEAAKPAVEPPKPGEPVKYEAFKLPENVRADDATLTRFTEIAGKIGIPQEEAQNLVDLYAQSAQKFVQHTVDEQQRVFAEFRRSERAKIMADPDIGGAGHQTAAAAIARMRDLFVPREELKAFNDMLRTTGCGDMLPLAKMMWRMAQKFDEAVPAPMPTNPPRDRGQPNGRASSVLYDHPTSQPGKP